MEKKRLYSTVFVELKQKIDELLSLNEEFSWDGDNASERFDARMKRQETLIDELRELAIENNTLLGRQLKFQMADSHALYIVTKVFKNQVQVTWIDWCDGWQDDRIGYQGNLPIDYVQQTVQGEDKMRVLFS